MTEASNIIAFRLPPKPEPEALARQWQVRLNREALAHQIGKLIRGSAEGEVA